MADMTAPTDLARVVEEMRASCKEATQGEWMYLGAKPWSNAFGEFQQWGSFSLSANSLDANDEDYYFIASISNVNDLSANEANARHMAACSPANVALLLDALPVWQPIETAPKDGTDIMLSNGDVVTEGHWLHDEGGTIEHRDMDGRWIGQDDCDGFDGWIDWHGGMIPEPTHWMPLPPPAPKEATA